jgi:hypothetical protein
MSLGQQTRKLTCRRREQVTLSGFYVGSNSTGLVHNEEMLDVGGGISLVENKDNTCNVVNRSTLNLHGVGLLRKTALGELEAAWIGDVPSQNASQALGTSVPRWNILSDGDAAKRLWASYREESPMSASNPPQGTLSLRGLLDIGQNIQDLGPGEVRLIGWSDGDLPGLSIKPAAPQAKRGILVIAHLRYGFGDSPQPDANLKTVAMP